MMPHEICQVCGAPIDDAEAERLRAEVTHLRQRFLDFSLELRKIVDRLQVAVDKDRKKD